MTLPNLIKQFIPRRFGGPKANIYNNFANKRKVRTFCTAVQSAHPSKLLEIGVFNGGGAKLMIQAAKDCGVKDIIYYGFDTFDGPPVREPNATKEIGHMEAVKQLLDSLNVKYKLFKGDTTETFPKAVPKLPKMDFIYIDGGHSYDTVKSDWENAEKLLHSKTIVVFDDYDQDGVAKVVNTLKERYSVKIVPIGIKSPRFIIKKRAVVRQNLN